MVACKQIFSISYRIRTGSQCLVVRDIYREHSMQGWTGRAKVKLRVIEQVQIREMQPLALVLWKRNNVVRDVSLIAAGTALLAICAQLTIPFYPVPFTLQTLSIMILGLSLGSRRAAASSALYLLLGSMGLPIFAGASAGFVHLFGPTGGYLISYPFAAGLLGWASEKGWDRSWTKALLAISATEAIVFTLGVGALSAYVGFAKAINLGFLIFVPAELLKIAVVIMVMPAIWNKLEKAQS